MRESLLSLRMLARDWRAGEIRVLAWALVIAVAAVTTVSFFTDRVQLAMARQANTLLGADLVVVSDHPLDARFTSEARSRGLQVANYLRFPSMVLKDERTLLGDIKVVSAGYPLRGTLSLSSGPGTPERKAQGIPFPGTVWADARLMSRLGLIVGDRIEVGASRFSVAGVVTDAPEQGVDFLSLGPSLIINETDLQATGLVQPGSRIRYRLLVAGDDKAVDAYRTWALQHLGRGEKLEGIRDARPELKSALERAERFLGLAALASVALAAAAVALAARRFSQRHLDMSAMLRCLGASQAIIVKLYLIYFVVLGTAASVAGCLIGLLAQQVLAIWLSSLVSADLPFPTWVPALQGLSVGMVLLLGFALPPVLNLRHVPTLRVLRREVGPPRTLSAASYTLGLVLLAGLVAWKAGDRVLAGWVLAGFSGAVAASSVLGWLAVRSLGGGAAFAGINWRFGLASIRRRAAGSVVQVTALGLGLMALLLLTLVRSDIMESWQGSLPPDAPNRFLVGIQPDQLKELSGFFQSKAMARPEFYPMVRGRLLAINDKPVSPESYSDPRARRLAEREFNLSWASGLQPDNRIVAGDWWGGRERGQALLSVEKGIAETLGMRLGDTLTYDVAGTRFSARIANLRAVEWDSFKVNFFVIASPGLLENFPASYISSFHLDTSGAPVMDELVKSFPNILVIDVAAIMGQVQRIMERVAGAVQFVFLFTLLAGLVVLYAAIVSTHDERLQEAAILRTLGATTGRLVLCQASEFVVLGATAGLFAGVGATVLGYVIAHRLLHLPFDINPWVWVAGMAAGAAGVTCAGLLGTRRTVTRPPLETLRRMG